MEDPREIINQLSHDDALAILRTLAQEDEQLARRIVTIARERLSDVDPEEVAEALSSDLEDLEVEEVWDKAGTKRHGYVETGDAAYKMIEDVLEPYLEDLRKYQKLGMSVESTRQCSRLLMGLYRFESESKTEFKNWASDAPISFAEEVVDAWKMGGPDATSVADLEEFVEVELGGWGRNLVD